MQHKRNVNESEKEFVHLPGDSDLLQKWYVPFIGPCYTIPPSFMKLRQVVIP